MNQVIDNNQRWVSFLNASGGEIPPYAVISFKSDKGASSDVANYSQRLVAKKFSDGDPCAATAFNSGAKVPDGKYGVCTFPVNGPCWARVDSGDMPSFADTLSDDDEWLGRDWGPTEDKWSITPAGSGFTICSRPDTDLNRVLVVAKDKVIVCKADEDIAKSASGKCIVYTGASSSGLTSTNYELDVYARTGAISKYDWVDVVRLPWGFEALGGGGGCPAVNTAWQVVFGGEGAVGGSWLLQISGLPSGLGTATDTAGPLAYDVSAAALQSALEALSHVGAGNVSVTGGAGSWVIQFIGDLSRQYIGPLAINGSSLSKGYNFWSSVSMLVMGHA